MLTGDIEAKAERQLVALEKQGLKVDILQVPHHGSRTSSTSLLLRKAAGHTAIASLARYNAWRMPAKNVLEKLSNGRFSLAGYGPVRTNQYQNKSGQSAGFYPAGTINAPLVSSVVWRQTRIQVEWPAISNSVNK
ncbi:ComEC family competence protein [Pantoea agglomerans]|uniref:ComEC family competence protein n=1 Tax=Enterobacter agglomerans TaxID=549 RepID=A0A379AJX2_ENTAG|nr:ComEC family competence protein [Pantoea agglomerans]